MPENEIPPVIRGDYYSVVPKSRLAVEKDIANNRKLCYTYDKLGRVLSRNVIDLTTDELLEEECESFSYDAAGNVLLPGYSYDGNNRLVTFNTDIEEPISYGYDADGNMIMEDHEWGSGHDCYSYDAKNRLKAKQAFWDNYAYDAEGLLCIEGEGDALGDILLTYNPHARLSQLLMAEGGVETVKFVYGLGLISHSKWSTSRFNEDNIEFPDENRYYHYDYRGSTTLLMTEDGMPCDRFSYSTYGACCGNGRPIFNYNGRDGVMWGSYMRNRFYMGNGRFYNADILTGSIIRSPSLNRYAYVEGNPVTNVDPLGLAVERGSTVNESLANTPIQNETDAEFWAWMFEKMKNSDGSWSLHDNKRSIFHRYNTFHEQIVMLQPVINLTEIGLEGALFTGGWELEKVDLSLLDFFVASATIVLTKNGLDLSLSAHLYKPSVSFSVGNYTVTISAGIIGVAYSLIPTDSGVISFDISIKRNNDEK